MAQTKTLEQPTDSQQQTPVDEQTKKMATKIASKTINAIIEAQVEAEKTAEEIDKTRRLAEQLAQRIYAARTANHFAELISD